MTDPIETEEPGHPDRAQPRPGVLAARPLLRRALVVATLLVSGHGVAGMAAASKVEAFRLASAGDFLSGTFDGVSVGPLGTLRLARALDKVASIEEPFLFTAAVDGDGWVIGTGSQGRVLGVTGDGTVNELFTTAEPEVFALLVEPDAIYAAASPEAKVYRYDRGTGEAAVVFDPGSQYVWALAREGNRRDGRLLVATGTEGKLFAYDEVAQQASLLYDTGDVHVRTLLVRDEDVLVGTVGEGRILSLRPRSGADGEPAPAASAAAEWVGRTLFDAQQPEITSLTAGPEGIVYAAAVASEASLAQLAPPSNGGDTSNGDNAATPPPVGTRPAGFEGARSVVLEVGRDGSVQPRGEFSKETVYSLLWEARAEAPEGGVLWVATGQEGKLYRSRGDEMVLERDLDELQIVQLLGGAEGTTLATTNAASLYRTSARDQAEGTYVSKVLDAKYPARFGTLHVEASAAGEASLGFAMRSGLSAFPDDTWSPWVDLGAPSASSGVPDLDLDAVPRGRYAQIRATFERGAGSPELQVVEVTYLQENQRPKITDLRVLDPGVILVQGSFNPSNQVFEAPSPNRDGFFNSLDEPATDTKGRPKQLWKLGYLTVQWKAEDPNEDTLRYHLSVRPESAEDRWYSIARDIEKSSWGFDTSVLPDGLYRVRVEAHDGESNVQGEVATAERTSGLVTIDNTSPGVARRQGRRITVRDALSPIRRVEISRNASPWVTIEPVDGLTDSREETYDLEAAVRALDAADRRAGRSADTDDAPLLLLRISDVAYNHATVPLN